MRGAHVGDDGLQIVATQCESGDLSRHDANRCEQLFPAFANN